MDRTKVLYLFLVIVLPAIPIIGAFILAAHAKH